MSINLIQNNNEIYVNKTFNTLLQSVSQIENEKKEIEFSVNNVVCSYSTRCHLNLRKIAKEGMHVEYRKENGMINMKLRKPYTTATIWSSGKITCTGAKSEPDAYNAARKYCRLLQKLGFKVKLCNYRVVNVLASCNMSFEIDIAKLANNYPKECSYEPELHPGATFTLADIKTTLKIFTTGSLTLTAPSVQVISTALTKMLPILNNYHKIKTSISNKNETQFNSIKYNDISQSNKIILNNAYENQTTNNINVSINRTQINSLLQCNTIIPLSVPSTNNYSNSFNSIHNGTGNCFKHKPFFVDDIDEEFLP